MIPFAIADHTLGLAHFVRDGDPQLFDEIEEVVLLDHHSARKWHAFADPDHFLQPVEQVENLDGAVRRRPRFLARFPLLFDFLLSELVVHHDSSG